MIKKRRSFEGEVSRIFGEVVNYLKSLESEFGDDVVLRVMVEVTDPEIVAILKHYDSKSELMRIKNLLKEIKKSL